MFVFRCGEEALSLDSHNVCDCAGKRSREGYYEICPGVSSEEDVDCARIHCLDKTGYESADAVEVNGPFGGSGSPVLVEGATAVITNGNDSCKKEIGYVCEERHIKSLESDVLETAGLDTELLLVTDVPGHKIQQDHIEAYGKSADNEKQGLVLVGSKGKNDSKDRHSYLIYKHFEYII